MTRSEYLDIYDVVGAAMEVYNTLGRGMSELIYQEALEIEMSSRGMIFEREKALRLYYKTVLLKKVFSFLNPSVYSFKDFSFLKLPFSTSCASLILDFIFFILSFKDSKSTELISILAMLSLSSIIIINK